MDTAAPPQTRRTSKLADTPRRALHLGTRLGAALVVVLLGSALGLWAAGDARLVEIFYGVRGARASQQQVLLVAVDDETVTAWGSPPYGWDRLAPLVAAILHGAPSVAAFAEPAGRLARTDAAPADVTAALAAHRLIAPAPLGTAGAPAEATGDALPVADTLTSAILDASGLHASRDPLPIDYLGGGLPVVSAARVAAGELPAATFTGKVVLIGMSARGLSATVATPVGPATPAEIQAQALLGLTDGVAWRVPGAAARGLLAILIGLATLIVVARVDETRALGLCAAAALALVLLSYLLFARGAVLFGPSAPIATVLAAAFVHGFLERRALRAGLADLGRDLRLRTGLDTLGPDSRNDASSAFWLRIAELARQYLDCRSSIVAELVPGRWHLTFRVLVGASLTDVAEQRRDVRRGSFHRALVTLSPVWQDDFMAEPLGLRTLLVPLSAQHHLCGFWILSFPADEEIETARHKLIAILAHQVAIAVERRQAAGARPEGGHPLVDLLGPGRLEADLGAVGVELRRLAADKRGLAALLDGVPFGILVATVWGEVRYANLALRKLLAEVGESRVQSLGLGDVLSALASADKDALLAGMRRLVRERAPLRLPGRSRRSPIELTLAWFGAEVTRSDSSDEEQLLVLTAAPAAAAGAVKDLADAPAEPAARPDAETTAFVRVEPDAK
jgi:CHASE2 domain-containing sensor protein